MKKILLVVFLIALVYACNRKAMPSVSKKEPYNAIQNTNADLSSEGRRVYQMKCGECHGLKNITDYTNQRWSEILHEMIPKAKLSVTEKQQLIAFISANAKG
jgi:hypothetical protein